MFKISLQHLKSYFIDYSIHLIVKASMLLPIIPSDPAFESRLHETSVFESGPKDAVVEAERYVRYAVDTSSTATVYAWKF